jgi:hypothetical protein
MRLDRLPPRLGLLAAGLLIGTSAFVTTVPRLVAAPGSPERVGSIVEPSQAFGDTTIGPITDPDMTTGIMPAPSVWAQPTPSPQLTPAPTPKPPPKATSRPTVTRPAPPKPHKAASNQRVAIFPTSGTQAQFLALMKNMSIDVIEMEPGTYRGWHLFFDIDRTRRPLTVRPAHGTVTFDNAGGGNPDGLLYPGWHGYTAHITFSGPFVIQNYKIEQTGLISTAWASHMAFNGFTVRGTTAPTTNGETAYAVYVSSDGVHRGSYLTFDNWNVDNTKSDQKVSGLQLYHTPQAIGVTALHWRVTGGHWGFVGRGDATGVKIEYWTISGCIVSFDSNGPAGIVKYVHASSSGAPTIRSPMVNGGGNTW